ncbi:MAG: hypothetical protein IJ817_03930 [Clostridia bacterium]|nr:hypothetical protein [Clostridia bacterium]
MLKYVEEEGLVSKTMDKKKPLHDGHRERLSELMLNAGIENVSKIQAVEYFLTYIFPRGDVNPLAHRLLDKYETFANIIDAEVSDLCTVEGINTRSARKIKLFGEMIGLYSSSKLSSKINLRNTGEFLDLLEQLLRLQSTENLYLFAIDHDFNLIQKRKYDLKKVRSVGISPYDLFNFIASTKLSYLIVAHNHPNGTARPSPDDHDAVIYIENLLATFDCKLIDSFIVGKDGIYSETQNSFVRTFATTPEIIDKIIKKLNT